MPALSSEYIVPLPSDKLWIGSLCKLVKSSISQGKQVVIIVIARKMARLFEYYLLNDSRLKELLDDNSDIISVITEHAIPTTLSGASDKDTTVCVVDDFMVFGDTVETVSENVYFLTGIKPEIIAIGASDQANFRPMGGHLFFPNPNSDNTEERKCVIKAKLMSAFTARNSYNIISLKEPIDLEHTIFEMNLSKTQYVSAIDNMEDWVKKIFPNSIVYEIRHKIPNTNDEAVNVTVCTDTYNSRSRNNDFNKFRFFIGDDKLRIVSYSPNIWEDGELQDDRDLFIYSELNKAWNRYRTALDNITYTDRKKEEDVFEGMFERQFKLRIELCRVVWANYLKSFENALIFKEELERLASKLIFATEQNIDNSNSIVFSDLTIGRTNLEWLLGKSLRDEIYQLLQDSLKRNEADCSVTRPLNYELEDNPLLPEKELDNYNSEKASLALLCPSVDSTLSILFYRLWTKFGLINNKNREERIRIGETYKSLEKYLRHIYNPADLRQNINRWMDERIDLGVVVPKYEYTYATLGRRLWRRYFRPGEREDSMVDVARICALITKDNYGTEPMSFDEFKVLLVPELEDICKASHNQVSLDCFFKGLFQKEYRKEEEEEENRDFVSIILRLYMILMGVYELTSTLSLKEFRVEPAYNDILLSGSPIYSVDK